MAKVFIQRTRQWSYSLVPIHIFIDGIKAGSIKQGGSLEIEIQEGSHSLQASFLRTGSNVVQLDGKFGNHYYFELGSDVNMLKNIFSLVKHPLVLASLYLIDKVTGWDYFLLVGLLAYIACEIVDNMRKKRARKSNPQPDKYYIYLREEKLSSSNA